MKKQFCKTMSYVMTAALLLGVSMPSSPAAAKKKAPKLSTKKVSISVGQKKTIKLKNGCLLYTSLAIVVAVLLIKITNNSSMQHLEQTASFFAPYGMI